MMKLDPSDLLDRAILKVLRGETIDFCEWEDLKEELEASDEEEQEAKPEFEEYLAQIGLTLDDAVRMTRAFQADFRKRAADYGIPLDDRPALVRRLAELAQTDRSPEFLRFFCELLSSFALFFRPEHEEFPDLVAAAEYIQARDDADELYADFSRRIEYGERFRAAISAKPPRQIPDAECDTRLKHQIFQKYKALLGAEESASDGIFWNNLDDLLQTVACTPELHPIAPLFLYQAVVRHRKRLHNSESPTLRLDALWQYRHYNIEQDNGKNLRQNGLYLRFFAELCELYRNDPEVDCVLCGYGFDQLSNLGDYYRILDFKALVQYETHLQDLRLEPDECPNLLPAGLPLYLPEPLEEILEDVSFCCWEGMTDNVILTGGLVSFVKYRRFQRSGKYQNARNKISDYVERNADDLKIDYFQIDPQDVGKIRAFCNQVLQAVELPPKEQPQKLSELPLFLAAVNEELISLLRCWDEEYLKFAGLALLGSRV